MRVGYRLTGVTVRMAVLLEPLLLLRRAAIRLRAHIAAVVATVNQLYAKPSSVGVHEAQYRQSRLEP